MTLKTFTAQLSDAVADAAIAVRRTIAKERLYSFALYTSGEDDFAISAAEVATGS